MYKDLIVLIFSLVILTSCCIKTREIKNVNLYDKVKACGGGIGLSESVILRLTNLHTNLPIEAKLNLGLQEQIKPLIFSELPEKDKLKGYEDYCKCIQKLHE